MWKPWKTVRNIFPAFSKPPINFSQQMAQLWSKGHYCCIDSTCTHHSIRIINSFWNPLLYFPNIIQHEFDGHRQCSQNFHIRSIRTTSDGQGGKDTLFEIEGRDMKFDPASYDAAWQADTVHAIQYITSTVYTIYSTLILYNTCKQSMGWKQTIGEGANHRWAKVSGWHPTPPHGLGKLTHPGQILKQR